MSGQFSFAVLGVPHAIPSRRPRVSRTVTLILAVMLISSATLGFVAVGTSNLISSIPAGKLAYDSQADRIILFGGPGAGPRGGFFGNNDTWAYDFNGNIWTNLNPSTRPPSRFQHAMVYDSRADRVIVFGGLGDGSNDTWAYDFANNTWANMNPANAPLENESVVAPAMAYDSRSDRIILYGGGGQLLPSETWAYDFNANTWTNMHPVTALPLSAGGMAYDSASDRIIFCTGETWAYDFNNNTWTNMNPAVHPSPRLFPAMAYDSGLDRILLFGGDTHQGSSDETWTYDFVTNTWTNVAPVPAPSVGPESVMVYDTRSDRFVLSSGTQTWSYDIHTNTWTDMNALSRWVPYVAVVLAAGAIAALVVVLTRRRPSPPLQPPSPPGPPP